MTLLYHDPIFQQHDTGAHPENARRLAAIHERLANTGLINECKRGTCSPVAIERLRKIHGLEHIKSIEQFAINGGGRIEVDTVVSPQSYDVARHASGAVCDAVERVVTGEATNALCLVRPPGHHTLPDGPMGFCLFNNIAVGARLAVNQFALDRVLIVDWDVHHGNGTQASFWTDPQVGFFSIHRWPFYPGTGDANETGSGDGLGTTLNLPIEYGTSTGDYFAQLETELTHFADKLQPQLILLSAGFDAHAADPVGSLGLESQHFADLTRIVMSLANQHCEGRLVSVLEGGYNPAKLAESVEFHLRGLLNSAS